VAEASLIVSRLLDCGTIILVNRFVAAREATIASQSSAICELSTPVVSLWHSVLLLLLAGVIDSVRALQVSKSLLFAIGRSAARVTLIDITGSISPALRSWTPAWQDTCLRLSPGLDCSEQASF
jgi:rsbT co-antagonist protein RsbR